MRSAEYIVEDIPCSRHAGVKAPAPQGVAVVANTPGALAPAQATQQAQAAVKSS